MLKDLVQKNRSYRRFDETARISQETLRELVELARMVPSAVNQQALRFRLVREEDACAEVFPTLGWAGLLKDWDGPSEGERPAAYILVLRDRDIGGERNTDVGIAAQTMLLGAVEAGLGGCMIGSVDRPRLAAIQGIDSEKYDICLVIALGKPKEIVRLVDMQETGSTRYYRDAQDVHCVPKRKLEELIV